MNTKYTKGPWHVGMRRHDSKTMIYGPQGKVTIFHQEIANCDMAFNSPDENEANARLIASAPELLKALENVLAEIEEAVPSVDFWSKKAARAAITKAKGGAA